MKIRNHRLVNDDGTPCRFVKSPNMGGTVEHKFLVMHYTAGRSAKESIEWLSSSKAKASAHLVIGRDGSVTQLVPFNRVAWHAGVSSWEGFEGLNRYSLGIEMDNAGRLTRVGDHWRAWFGIDYDDSQVIESAHKSQTKPCGWEIYTPQQIASALEVAGLLIDDYGLLDVVGHEDIAPGRKFDPGPAFPMTSFRAKLFGRADDQPALYETITDLNIRSGPGPQFSTLSGTPLSPNTQVRFISAEGSWWQVDVLQHADLEGWVNSRYLTRLG